MTEGRPRLSIITVCFNAEDGIAATVASVRAIRFLDYEYIVIDGASRDGTLDILRSQGGCISKLVSEPDKGIYDAMNKGIALARGEFVWFLNAKDTIHDAAFLERLDWQRDFYYGGVVLRDGNRETKRLMPKPRVGPYSSLFGQVACHQSMLVRRTVAPTYDTRYRFVADFDWSIRILRTKGLRAQRVESYLVNYEIDGVSRRNASRCWQENIAILARNYGRWTLPLAYSLYARFLLKERLKRLLGGGL